MKRVYTASNLPEAHLLVDHLADHAARLFHPKAGSALIGAGTGTLRADYDFDGRPRAGNNDAGAYVYPSQGRPLREGFKTP